MKYTFTITKDGAESEEKAAMSYKKVLKSLTTSEPKWSGVIKYKYDAQKKANQAKKKQKGVIHFIRNGRKYNTTV